MKKKERVVRFATLAQLISEAQPPREYPACARRTRLSPRSQAVLRYLWGLGLYSATIGQIAAAVGSKGRQSEVTQVLLDLSSRGLVEVLDRDRFRARQAAPPAARTPGASHNGTQTARQRRPGGAP